MIKSLLEAAIVIHFIFCFFFLGPVLMSISAFCLITPLAPLVFAYAIWLYIDRDKSYREGRRVEWLRHLPFWNWFANYFPTTLHVDPRCELTSDKNYMIAHHPHACICLSNMVFLATDGFSRHFPNIDVTTLTLDANFFVPFMREYLLALGLGAVSAESIEFKLTKQGPGKAVVIVPGGAAEAHVAEEDEPYRLVLKHRKGFIKMALRTGLVVFSSSNLGLTFFFRCIFASRASVVPVCSFGEMNIYKIWKPTKESLLHKFQHFIHQQFRFVPLIFYGRFGPFLPYRSPIHTCSKPFELPHVAKFSYNYS